MLILSVFLELSLYLSKMCTKFNSQIMLSIDTYSCGPAYN